ncbi:primase-helicase family protein [Thalassobacter stenotrophicus]|uniref:primase-helicase family protein n=1 Tax=Thalassobacter stenotrophicus TaxID=266809 RepID=UPI00068E3881|nr:primase-helicase family protein [Thalassobacter stenotrophicus]
MTEKNNDDWLVPKTQEGLVKNPKDNPQGLSSPHEPEMTFDSPNLTEEEEARLEAEAPLTDEAKASIATIERRMEQGLYHHPFPDDMWSGFVRLNDDGTPYNPSSKEILSLVCGWFVKKDNKYHDVNNLQTSYQAQDLKQVIVSRIKVLFPNLHLTNKDLKEFFLVLLDPPISQANPEENIPVWSGHTVCLPANTQKLIFKDGVATVNLWEYPAYRRGNGTQGTAFDAFLSFVIPDQSERDVFLDWLAWALKYEDQKPRWAVMLYSLKQGTGKTVLTDLVKELFGVANTSRINGVRQLVARFNKEILQHKLVIVEEIEVRKGSKEANQVKSLITEDSTTVEAKGLPSSVEPINCAFLMTTNHLPTWLEDADRRFYILNFDHEGYNHGGEDYEKFVGLVKNLKAQTNTPGGVKGIYDQLMARDLKDHNAMSLDVSRRSTSLMKELQMLSPDVVKEELNEVLRANNIVFLTSKQATELINKYASREANAQTHLFTELGYKKARFAWGGVKSQKACWYLPSAKPGQGEVLVGGIKVSMALHLEKVDDLLTTPILRIGENSLTKKRQHETNDVGTVSQFLRVDEDF